MNDRGPAPVSDVELVIGILHGRLGEQALTLDPALKQRFDSIIGMANYHDVSAALAGGLKRSLPRDDPWRDLLPFFEAIEASNRTRNLAIIRAIIDTAPAVAAAGIPILFLKGNAFQLDDSSALDWRSVADIDVLVAEQDIPKVAAILSAHGYLPARDPGAFDTRLHHHSVPLLDRKTGIFFELHGRLMQDEAKNPVNSGALFAQAGTVWREGQQFLIPCPEHRAMHLIAHAQISNWGYVLRHISLKGLIDAAELDSRHRVDWAIVRKAFSGIGAEDELMGFLWAAHVLLGLALPFPGHEFRKARLWSDDAIKALSASEPNWRVSARILGHYLRLFAQNPSRLKIILEILKDPVRRKELLRINRGRLGLPEG